MVKQFFEHIETWVFDLDNTLYPPHVRLFDQIEERMRNWVMAALDVDRDHAEHLRITYWRDYGTTLAGLMAKHDVDPKPYLVDVHEIDFSELEPDPALADRICALPGRKIVYTNGPIPYAKNVLSHRGLSNVFDAVYGVESADFKPKPERRAFELVFAKSNTDPTKAAMFEDVSRNLLAPHDMGMRTVLVAPVAEKGDHIHHHTDDLTAFLAPLGDAR